jgi:hypothetical protein
MKIAIIGDSFTVTYKDTWIEAVCNELDLQVIHQVGYRGMAQYKIYLEFLEVIKNNPEIVICCHTDYGRLYHPKKSIHRWKSNQDNNNNFNKLVEQYYSYLYDESLAKFLYFNIIEKMQKICKQRNIKLVNIPCFKHQFIDKTYGLWLLCNNGLLDCSRADYKREYGKDWVTFEDPRLNHFSTNGHQVLAQNIIPHIKTYITTDQELHTVLLFPELFA